jgi:hypothetical protein
MNIRSRNAFRIRTGLAAMLAVGATLAPPVHAGGFYGPRNTIPAEPLAAVTQDCGGVFAPSWAGPRPRFEKVRDFGPCPAPNIQRWAGPRATIPVYKD